MTITQYARPWRRCWAAGAAHICTWKAAEALDCLDSFQPQVVIADYRLRGNQTGQQVLKQIYQQLGRTLHHHDRRHRPQPPARGAVQRRGITAQAGGCRCLYGSMQACWRLADAAMQQS
jgi:hypothetical protein